MRQCVHQTSVRSVREVRETMALCQARRAACSPPGIPRTPPSCTFQDQGRSGHLRREATGERAEEEPGSHVELGHSHPRRVLKQGLVERLRSLTHLSFPPASQPDAAPPPRSQSGAAPPRPWRQERAGQVPRVPDPNAANLGHLRLDHMLGTPCHPGLHTSKTSDVTVACRGTPKARGTASQRK